MSLLARENPFQSAHLLRARFRMSEPEWSRLIARLESLGMRGAIVGRKGRGKTTLLEDLAERLAGRGEEIVLARIPSGQRELPRELRAALAADCSRKVFLVDSAGQLSTARRLWLSARTRRAAGLVVTAHRAGLMPTLVRLETSPELLEELVRQISGRETRAFGRSAAELFARHRGNLRDALRELYDVCAGRETARAS